MKALVGCIALRSNRGPFIVASGSTFFVSLCECFLCDVKRIDMSIACLNRGWQVRVLSVCCMHACRGILFHCSLLTILVELNVVLFYVVLCDLSRH